MARPDIGFEGSSDKYAVQSRSPIFFDEYDIAYLYQFPPQFWTGAMAARYNQFLYEAKTQGDKYNDIQDVAIKSQGGATIIFKQRNTFAKHLVDKIQRDIDVDFFRISNNCTVTFQHNNGFGNSGKFNSDSFPVIWHRLS